MVSFAFLSPLRRFVFLVSRTYQGFVEVRSSHCHESSCSFRIESELEDHNQIKVHFGDVGYAREDLDHSVERVRIENDFKIIVVFKDLVVREEIDGLVKDLGVRVIEVDHQVLDEFEVEDSLHGVMLQHFVQQLQRAEHEVNVSVENETFDLAFEVQHYSVNRVWRNESHQ